MQYLCRIPLVNERLESNFNCQMEKSRLGMNRLALCQNPPSNYSKFFFPFPCLRSFDFSGCATGVAISLCNGQGWCVRICPLLPDLPHGDDLVMGLHWGMRQGRLDTKPSRFCL